MSAPAPQRILLIRLTALGDVVLALPALSALRARFPEARIEWLVEAPYAPLLAGVPGLDGVVAYEKRGRHAGAAGWLALRSELAERGYDLVIDLQRKAKTVALAAGLGAPQVLGLRKRQGWGWVTAALGRERPATSPHVSELYLGALEALGVERGAPEVRLPVSARAREAAAPFLSRPWPVVIAPGATWATKRWSPRRFGELARALHDEGHAVVLGGGPSDREAVEEARAASGLPLQDTCDAPVEAWTGLLAASALLIANDSGPVHLAHALGTPVVVLFGPTAPGRWAPRDGPVRVLSLGLTCSPCSNHGTERCPLGTHACLEGLPADQVLEAGRALLRRGEPPRG